MTIRRNSPVNAGLFLQINCFLHFKENLAMFTYSKTGLYKTLKSEENSDAIIFNKPLRSNISLTVIRDGSSSSLLSKMAAEITCKATHDFFLDYAEHISFSDISECESVPYDLRTEIIEQLEALCHRFNLPVNSKSADSTLLAVLINNNKITKKLYYISIGPDNLWFLKEGRISMVVGSYEDRENTVFSDNCWISSGIKDLSDVEKVIFSSDGMTSIAYHGDKFDPILESYISNNDFYHLEKHLNNMTNIDDATLRIYSLDL